MRRGARRTTALVGQGSHRAASLVRLGARRAPSLVRRLGEQEDGQTLVLGVGLVAVVLALVLVVASASAVYLDLKRLTAMADQTAAAAARSVDEAAYYASGSPGQASSGEPRPAGSPSGSPTGSPATSQPPPTASAPVLLTDAGVRAAAADHLAAQERSGGLSGVSLSAAAAVGPTTAVVTLTARSQPPFLPWGIIPAEGFTLTATGSARGTTSPS